ncbi:uncharacterized protein KQ657_000501 [Scheffersomyces spartinae]|uniref:2-dehydropantolactone reductase n=1 Tax=Scheffersomyces spartinae TaxID=45513 RepID=A0A9P7VAG0_9ASCO|nr:uncharacterized protein KQ657_000501 [Scheffersomyces spartinae]KAG7193808.1 hypothetical protein KQ657_000501 [Scheffersomyces spartinae]
MPAIPSVTLNNGTKIPILGLGCYLLGRNTTSEIVYNAIKLGYRHFDTAQMYGNEREVGQGIMKWINENPQANKRSDIYYTTKLLGENQGYDSAKRAIRTSFQKVNQLEYIDLFLIHDPMTNKDKRLGAWKALQEAVEEGLIKSIGISSYGIRHMKELLEWDGLTIKPVVNQIELNPWLTRKEIVQYCKDHSIYLETFSPLTKGFKFNDHQLQALATKYNKSPAQILIKWNLQNDYIVIPKSSNLQRQLDNMNVFDFAISDEDMKMITHDEAYEYFDWDPTDYMG